MMRALKRKGTSFGETSHAEDAIFNSLPVGLMVFDEDTRLVNANNYIFKTFSMDSINPEGYYFGELFRCKNALKGNNRCSKMPVCDNCALLAAVRQVLRTGESRTGVEVSGEFLINGRITTKSFLVNLSCDVEGFQRYAMAAITDITSKRRAEQELSVLGISDELTGLYTRRYLFKKLDELIQIKWPEAYPLSVALINIDRLDEVSKKYANDTGDYLLKSLADILKNFTRSTDIIGRCGKNEFLAVFVKTDAEAASRIVSEMMEAFGEKTKERLGEAATFSTGLVTVEDKAGSYCDVNDFISDAESMLAAAKQKGGKHIENEQEAFF